MRYHENHRSGCHARHHHSCRHIPFSRFHLFSTVQAAASAATTEHQAIGIVNCPFIFVSFVPHSKSWGETDSWPSLGHMSLYNIPDRWSRSAWRGSFLNKKRLYNGQWKKMTMSLILAESYVNINAFSYL